MRRGSTRAGTGVAGPVCRSYRRGIPGAALRRVRMPGRTTHHHSSRSAEWPKTHRRPLSSAHRLARRGPVRRRQGRLGVFSQLSGDEAFGVEGQLASHDPVTQQNRECCQPAAVDVVRGPPKCGAALLGVLERDDESAQRVGTPGGIQWSPMPPEHGCHAGVDRPSSRSGSAHWPNLEHCR